MASARTAEYYKKRPCPQLVRLAAEIMEEYIAENQPAGPCGPAHGKGEDDETV